MRESDSDFEHHQSIKHFAQIFTDIFIFKNNDIISVGKISVLTIFVIMNWIVVGSNNVGNITNIRRAENRWFEALPSLPPPQTARSLEATILSVANPQSFILLDLIPYIWYHILEVGYHLSDINLSNHGSDILYLLLHIFHITYLA